MSRKRKPDSALPRDTAPDVDPFAIGACLLGAPEKTPTEAVFRPEDLDLAIGLGFQSLVVEMDFADMSSLESFARSASGHRSRLDLYVKVRIPPDFPPGGLSEKFIGGARILEDIGPRWILDLPGGTAHPAFRALDALVDRTRETLPSGKIGLWLSCIVAVPDDPDSPWDTRVARAVTAETLAQVPDPAHLDFIVMAWQGSVTLRFSPFRPFARWRRVWRIQPPDARDTAYFAEGLSMVAALRRPILVVDRHPGPLDAAWPQAMAHCACLGAFAGETAQVENLLGYCWDPFLVPANGNTPGPSAAGLVLLDTADGSRTPYPETFGWVAACRRAFHETRKKEPHRDSFH